MQQPEVVVKRLTHYRSDHKILLVGEGDFSFSLCLARSFGSASNIVASSLDSYDDVTKKYKQAKSNLDELRNLGACLLHGVDATEMMLHSYLQVLRFDRIIFNFPHAGFYGKEDNLDLIEMHKNLVSGFFENASCLLRANGEIHVNHKTSPPYCDWNLEELARQSCLTLNECVNFNKEDYPGYNNKRGHSNRCDLPFNLGECSTFKFIHNPRALGKRKRIDHKTFRQQRHSPFQEIRQAVNLSPSVDFNFYPQTSHIPRTNGYTPTSASHSAHGMSLGSQRSLLFQPWPKSTNVTSFPTDHVRREEPLLPSVGARNKGYQIPGHYSNYLQEAGGPTAESSGYNSNSVKRSDFERFIIRLSGARNAGHHAYSGSSNHLPEVPGRTAWVRQ